jgi:hypothetical protein
VIQFLYATVKLKAVAEKTGVFTFFLDSVDGLGNTFQKYIQSLNINNVQITRVNIDQEKIPDYWNHDYFLAPMLTDIRYSQE